MKKILLLAAFITLPPLSAAAQTAPARPVPAQTLAPQYRVQDDPQKAQERNDIVAKRLKAIFLKEQRVRKAAAAKLTFSADTRLENLVRRYPFLAEDLRTYQDRQKAVLEYAQKNGTTSASAQTPDLAPIIRVAESRGSGKQPSFFFVAKRGDVYCGAHGCPLDIYVNFPDQKKGYQKLQTIMTPSSDIYIARTKDTPSLFFGTAADSPEWQLKLGTLEKAAPMTIGEWYKAHGLSVMPPP